MKQAQRKQPVVSVENAPGEVIILPPVQVRRTTPTVTRWLRELTQRLLPPLLGLGVLLLAWQLAAMHSKGFPTPLSTLDSALTLFADPFYQDGPNDMGIGWNVLASLQRVAVGFGLAALAGIPLGFLIGRSLFFARMFNPLIALLRPVSPLAWLPSGDADIRSAVMQQRFDFLRGALHQLDANVGEQLAESFNHRGQAVARLGMGGGDG